MKNALLTLMVLASACSPAVSQEGEFERHPNGLVYSEATMASLHRIVDSMNLRFKKCEPWKEYRALSQAIGHHVKLDTGDVLAARADMNGGISFDAFRRKYPLAKAEDSLLVVRSVEMPYDNDGDRKPFASFESLEMRAYGGHSVSHDDTTLASINLRGRWVVEYEPKSEYSRESVEAFYFPAAFESRTLAPRFARSVQYADCMIDTASEIFFPGARRTSVWGDEGKPAPGTAFKAWQARVKALDIPAKPESKDYKKGTEIDDAYYDALEVWDSTRDARINEALQRDGIMRDALAAVAEEAQSTGSFDAKLEALAEKHLSAKDALALKRSRIVVGGCSQDRSPRYHALHIARLAAESVSWDIFLRAHLDILNDRFERVSDGSYAWGGRQTYLRELEELDFDVAELMMGTTYRIANPSGHHYFGSIPRQGRALAEYSQRARIEGRMAADMADVTLDDYNRMMAYYLFRSYAIHTEDDATKEATIATLKEAVKGLPVYLQRRIEE